MRLPFLFPSSLLRGSINRSIHFFPFLLPLGFQNSKFKIQNSKFDFNSIDKRRRRRGRSVTSHKLLIIFEGRQRGAAPRRRYFLFWICLYSLFSPSLPLPPPPSFSLFLESTRFTKKKFQTNKPKKKQQPTKIKKTKI